MESIMKKNMFIGSLMAICALGSGASPAQADCQPIVSAAHPDGYQIEYNFPMSPQENDKNQLNGPVGDYPNGYMGYPDHVAFGLNYMCGGNWGLNSMNCVANLHVVARLHPNSQDASTLPYGANNWVGYCGHK
jgi:hypothetical protein